VGEKQGLRMRDNLIFLESQKRKKKAIPVFRGALCKTAPCIMRQRHGKHGRTSRRVRPPSISSPIGGGVRGARPAPGEEHASLEGKVAD